MATTRGASSHGFSRRRPHRLEHALAQLGPPLGPFVAGLGRLIVRAQGPRLGAHQEIESTRLRLGEDVGHED